MEITGKIIEISAVKQVTDAYKKREFVVEYSESGGKYMEYIKFELGQEKTSLVDEFNEGDTVEVAFNLRGRAWEKNGEKIYFNSLQAWKVKKAGTSGGTSNTSSNASSNSNTSNKVEESAEPVAAKSFTAASEEDDLPF